MAEQPQTIVEPSVPPDKAFGARKEQNLRSAFAESPIYKGELTDSERKKGFQKEVTYGATKDNE